MAGLLSETPVDLRRRIVSGMRWTLWLSVLSVPFSYGTTILLARSGPQVLGTYGLLMVYIGLVASLFYLGRRRSLHQVHPRTQWRAERAFPRFILANPSCQSHTVAGPRHVVAPRSSLPIRGTGFFVLSLARPLSVPDLLLLCAGCCRPESRA